MKRIEPSSCLVNTLSDEVSRTSEALAAEIAQAFLSIRHCSGIEPDVNEVSLACHLLSAVGNQEDIVHIRSVKINPVVIFL